MKKLTLDLNDLHLSGRFSEDKPGFPKTYDFRISQPEDKLKISISVPILGQFSMDLDFIDYLNGKLRFHILTPQKTLQLALKFIRNIHFLYISYPVLMIDVNALITSGGSGTKIRNIRFINKKIILELELS